jgi:hypothetical protein
MLPGKGFKELFDVDWRVLQGRALCFGCEANGCRIQIQKIGNEFIWMLRLKCTPRSVARRSAYSATAFDMMLRKTKKDTDVPDVVNRAKGTSSYRLDQLVLPQLSRLMAGIPIQGDLALEPKAGTASGTNQLIRRRVLRLLDFVVADRACD